MFPQGRGGVILDFLFEFGKECILVLVGLVAPSDSVGVVGLDEAGSE